MEYHEGNNRFYVLDHEGNEIAEMTFQRVGDSLAVIDHTYVDVRYRGQGIADRLFDAVVNQMRKEGRKILPLCSFAVRQFEIKPQYKDSLAEE